MQNLRFARAVKRDIEILKLITLRDIQTKYRGSKLGIIWSVVNPLIMLSVYTFVFSEVLKTRWGAGDISKTSTLDYGVNLFCGLIVFNLFSESITRAPTLISSNPNYVKKIIFPLHTLGIMAVTSSVFQCLSSYLVLIGAVYINKGFIPLTTIMVPIILIPLILKCVGMTWLIATIGVFLRDIGQLVGACISILMFMSPVFYPITAVPEQLQVICNLNPLAVTIESTRMLMISGIMPRADVFIIDILVSIIWCEICYRILTKFKEQFADYL